ncbi:MAG: single-stranded DNA-binding protein, partial [Nitrospirae bacterium]|nr:single-stranded DNA-binding protein [Nitrospirota bacterium]
SWKDAAGQRQERTIWWRISVFGKQAELCCEYLQKGRQIFVEGCLRADPSTGGPRIWTGQDGTVRAVFEVTAFNVRFVGGRPEAQEKQPVEAASVSADSGEENGREIPF